MKFDGLQLYGWTVCFLPTLMEDEKNAEDEHEKW